MLSFKSSNVFFKHYRKCQGVNYLSDAEFNALTRPGPDTYGQDTQGPDCSQIQKNRSSRVALKMPIKGLDKDWRYKKTNAPDPGSYDVMEPALHKSSTMKRPQSAKFSNKENKRFRL